MTLQVTNGNYRWSDPAVRASDVDSLGRTPILVREILVDRPAEWLDARHDTNRLSPREALEHFIDCDKQLWIPRVRHILESAAESPFGPVDVFDGSGTTLERSIADLADEFAALRSANLAQLERLGITDDDLGRTAIHPKLGRVTLDQLLATWVAHDLYHLGQIFKSFSAPFQSAVGPWQEFLNLPHFN